MLYIRDSDFIIVQTKIEAKIWIFFSLTPCLLISFFIFLLFVDW